MNMHLFRYRLISLVLTIAVFDICQASMDQEIQPVQTTMADTEIKQIELSDVTAHVEPAAQPIVAGGASIASDIVTTSTATHTLITDPAQATIHAPTLVQDAPSASPISAINEAGAVPVLATETSPSRPQENVTVTQVMVGPSNSQEYSESTSASSNAIAEVESIASEITQVEQDVSEKPEKTVLAETGTDIDQVARAQSEFDEGIDTLDEEDSGNWYLKRSLWKKAKPKYDEIRKVANRVERSIKTFLDKRKKIEEANEVFYFEMGIDQGEITQVVSDIIEMQKKQQSVDAQLDEEQKKEISDTQNKKEEELVKLKNYVDVIKKTDDNLMDAIFNSLIEQQQLVQSYEEKALDNYYKISEILDDKKARELLNEMDNYVENVFAIEKWINGPLTQYVDQSAVRLTDLIQKTHMLVSSLKQQGIEIKKQLSQNELSAEEALKKSDAEKLAKAQAAARAAMKQKGFFTKIWSAILHFFTSLFELITAPFTYLYSLIVGSSNPAVRPTVQINQATNV